MTTASDSLSQLKKQLETSQDLKSERLQNGYLEIDLIYFSSLCNPSILKKSISDPFQECTTVEEFRNVLRSTLSCNTLNPSEKLLTKMLGGFVGVFFLEEVYVLYANKPTSEQPLEAKAESTLQGPQTALSENIDTNIKIIRERYPSPALIAEGTTVGKLSQTKLSILYDDQFVNKTVLEKLKKNIDQIQADIVQALGQLEALFTEQKYRLFPITILTERPDRIVLGLAQGKIVILMQGTPFAIIAPAVFFDFMTAMDDLYQTFWVSRAMVALRYVALFLTITLPAAYIAIVSYNPEIFRVQFSLSIAGSRAAVPYPSYVEVTIMLFMIEALIEASIRLPRYIGSTATTVGGLILGQAAQQAGIVSSIMIIITSVVAIANFVIPINAMSFAFRVVKYPLIMMATFFGMYGLVSGLFCFLMYLSNLQSFGEPYFRMFIGEKEVSGYKEGDTY
ncbi:MULTISPECIES: spore germination protein [unclassified Paenibacillus]|uniref:spore germination protein n=1 Tax=unclassified Paenibacillus TaxID=185978 RepID=UPI001AE1CBD2|nr:MULTISPECIES: spore germination protein [unclassified Paenibacillus]MBP1154182.1 spore germination protein [Paenibacillus sp. PvP091]MBP1170433.1 spore germination protein [Paenibacillus sp. PvR098]MBP2441461.1 spore germination protein [Paenibacillus sp. PvP052]